MGSSARSWLRIVVVFTLVLISAMVPGIAAAADTTCSDAVQGKIAWNYQGNTAWDPGDIARLCRGDENSDAPAQCFNRIVHGSVDWGGGTQWQYQNAIDLCEGSRNAEATVVCFQSNVAQGWQNAIAACDERSAVAATTGAPAEAVPPSNASGAAQVAPPPPAAVAPAASGWVACADEGGTCSFPGTRQVRYGANGVYSTLTVTGGTACNNGVFGDPTPGVVKTCEYSEITQTARTGTAASNISSDSAASPAPVAASGKTTTPVMDQTTAQILGASTEPDICWKDSYGRGVGEVPSACPNGWERTGADLLCYPICESGYYGFGPVCWQDCPADFRNDGAFCAKPGPYGRGAGYPWEFGDTAFSLDDARARCRRDNPQGCEKSGEIIYPQCKPGYHAVGCCICSPDCPASMTDIGVSCAKKSYGRGVGQGGSCPAGQEQDFQGGLCYPGCEESSTGVGPVCWSSCPSDYPVNCGAACGVNEAACAFAIIEQVQSSADVALNVAALVATAGTATPALKAAQTAGRSAKKSMTKVARKQMQNQIEEQLTKAVKSMRKLNKVKKAQNWLDKSSNVTQASSMLVDTYEKGEFDFMQLVPSVADVEPTGVLAVVNSFNKPICGR